MLEEVCVTLTLGWEAHGRAGGALLLLQHKAVVVEEGTCRKQSCRLQLLLVLWLQRIAW